MSRRIACLGALLLPLLLAAPPAAAGEDSVWDRKKNAWLLLDPAQTAAVHAFAEDYKAFLHVARTARLSTREVLRLARAAGFVELDEAPQLAPGTRFTVTGRDRSVLLGVVGREPILAGSRLVAAHHDSPHLMLKARPVVAGAGGFALLKTVPYGGLKKYHWANEPLALLGHVDLKDGSTVEVSVGLAPDEPVFVIPDAAPHADKPLRERSYTEVLAGEELSPVAGSIPGADASVVAQVLAQLGAAYGIGEEDLVSAELSLVPAVRPLDVGLDRGLVGGYGQDDRLLAYCAVRALLELEAPPRYTALVYLANFEEVGSINNTSARSLFVSTALARLVAAQRGQLYTELDLRTALRRAQVVSADANDGVNPLFPQTVETSNAARLGHGVVLKLYRGGFNANSEFLAQIRSVLDAAGIPWQTHTPKVETGTGNTIGGFFSALDMEVVDMGVPLLSMHAPFEMASKADAWNFHRFVREFYQR